MEAHRKRRLTTVVSLIFAAGAPFLPLWLLIQQTSPLYWTPGAVRINGGMVVLVLWPAVLLATMSSLCVMPIFFMLHNHCGLDYSRRLAIATSLHAVLVVAPLAAARFFTFAPNLPLHLGSHHLWHSIAFRYVPTALMGAGIGLVGIVACWAVAWASPGEMTTQSPSHRRRLQLGLNTALVLMLILCGVLGLITSFGVTGAFIVYVLGITACDLLLICPLKMQSVERAMPKSHLWLIAAAVLIADGVLMLATMATFASSFWRWRGTLLPVLSGTLYVAAVTLADHLNVRYANTRENLQPRNQMLISSASSTPISRVIPDIAFGLVVTSVILTVVSFFFTPWHSGIPASFGSVVQPLLWLGATATTVFAGFTTALLAGRAISLRNSADDGPHRRAAIALATILFSMDLAQFLFALFGPDI